MTVTMREEGDVERKIVGRTLPGASWGVPMRDE
jgi:hypothetical protein